MGGKITIIIPCIKINHLLKLCIEKCLELENKSDIEIFVVCDDKNLLTTFPQNVKFLHCEKNTMSAKRNYAARQSRADYLAFIDSDAYPHKAWLINAVTELELDQSLGMVGGPELPFEKENIWEHWVGLASKSKLISGGHAFRKQISPRRFFSEMSSCNLIVRRLDYMAVNGMDETLYIGEDHNFGIRIRALGKKILFSPDVIVHHKNRELFPFLIQRYARGMAVSIGIKHFLKDLVKQLFHFDRNLKETVKKFRFEFFVAPGFIAFLLSFFLMFLVKEWIYIYIVVISLYVAVLALETIKISHQPKNYFGVYITLLTGTLSSGVGSLLSLFNINPQMNKYYRNKNDR